MVYIYLHLVEYYGFHVGKYTIIHTLFQDNKIHHIISNPWLGIIVAPSLVAWPAWLVSFPVPPDQRLLSVMDLVPRSVVHCDHEDDLGTGFTGGVHRVSPRAEGFFLKLRQNWLENKTKHWPQNFGIYHLRLEYYMIKVSEVVFFLRFP